MYIHIHTANVVWSIWDSIGLPNDAANC